MIFDREHIGKEVLRITQLLLLQCAKKVRTQSLHTFESPKKVRNNDPSALILFLLNLQDSEVLKNGLFLVHLDPAHGRLQVAGIS